MLDVLGHIGYMLMLSGMVLIARHDSRGWKLRIVGGLLWVVVGALMGMSSIVVWGLVFAVVDYRSWRKWS